MQNMNFDQFPKDQYWQIPQVVTGLQNTVSMQCKQITELQRRIAQLEQMVFPNFYAYQQNALVQCQQPVMPEYQEPLQKEYLPQNFEPQNTNAYETPEKKHMDPMWRRWELEAEPTSGVTPAQQPPKVVQKQTERDNVRPLPVNKTNSLDERSRAVALDLRASVCKLLWVHYDELQYCKRVPENLREVYRKDFSKLQGTDVERVIEAQVKFLRVLRIKVWEEKQGEIAVILKGLGYLAEGEQEVTEAHVTQYLRDRGYREKTHRPKKRGGQTGIGLIEIWRDCGCALSDQVGERLRCAAPEEAQQVSPSRPKKTVWDKLQSQKEKIALIFQCSEQNLANVLKIPADVRKFYAEDQSAQRLRSQKELQSIMDDQTKLLKTHQDVLTIMNQRETIKRLMRVNELNGSNKKFPLELQKLYNDRALVINLTKEKRKHIKLLQQEFITKYRAEVIAPVKRALTNLLRQRGYQPALSSDVLNTSQIRYYFRSVDFAKWKLIREDSLQETYGELKEYLDAIDKMKKAESAQWESASVPPQMTMSIGRNDRAVEAERAELMEAMQTPLVTIDEQQKQEVDSVTHSMSAHKLLKEELHRKNSTCSLASGRSRMGWASEMSYYDEHSVSANEVIPENGMADLEGQEPKKDQQKPFYALASV